jgi:hypothetical protein
MEASWRRGFRSRRVDAGLENPRTANLSFSARQKGTVVGDVKDLKGAEARGGHPTDFKSTTSPIENLSLPWWVRAELSPAPFEKEPVPQWLV